MATNNNFKQLEKEDQEMTPHAPRRIERQVMGIVNTSQFAGNVLELYFTKLIQMFLMLFGVEQETEEVLQEKAAKIDLRKNESPDSQDVGEVR